MHTQAGKCLKIALFSLLATILLTGCGGAATAGPVATPTPTATATAAPPTATPKAEFADPLTSNTHGWPTNPGHCQFANGGLQISDAVCALPFFDAEDGAISLDAKATAGDPGAGFGLVWRASSAGLYEFGITANGTWGFVKLVGSAYTTVDTGENDAIRQGFNVTNSLKVSFRGSHFEFFVNGVKVTEEDDPSLASGVIGMFTYRGGTAVFNNLAYFP